MNKDEIAIDVDNITKKFKIYLDKGNDLKERLLFRKRNRYEERMVLRGISFQVKKGEAIGLIGHNGCGKSTTLKLLTKIMYPDSGTIKMNGRVSSLIELGAGFHPDMSGRENIYTNASIFGLTKKEIDERLNEIITFSELEDFIDNPVRTYSSGMYMRLAFSVAINVDADILLIDEILGVGDANFQAKCFNKLKSIKASGASIVIVSHSLGQIEQICERSIWIHEGVIKAEGSPKEIDLEYLEFMGQKLQENTQKELENKNKNQNKIENIQENSESNQTPDKESKKRWGNGKAHISDIKAFDENEKEQKVFKTGENIKIRIEYIVNQKIEDAVFGIGIFNLDGIQCYGTNTRIDKFDAFNIEKNGIAEIILDDVNLLSGEYLIDIAIESGDGIPVDYFREAYRINIISSSGDVGITRIKHNWII